MKERDQQARQLMGCGYAPPPSEILRPYVERYVWDGTSLGRKRGSDEMADGHIRLPVCPGYVCSLPEVIETSWAHAYWEKGELTQWCEGQSTPQLRDAVELLALESAEATSWATDNPVKR
jgi:hypothetical protein